MKLDLQPVRPEDEPFLFELYASTRSDEMALVGWDKRQQEAFLRMQFNAQRSSYAMQFPNADYRIIVHDDRAAGRLIVDRSGEDILLIDVALLPEFRNAGIGSALEHRPVSVGICQSHKAVIHRETSGPLVVEAASLHLCDRRNASASGVPPFLKL